MNTTTDITAFNILADIATKEWENLHNPMENSINQSNQQIRLNILNKINDKVSKMNDVNMKKDDKVKYVIDNLSHVDSVLMTAFVHKTKYVKKDAPLYVTPPNVTYTNNQLVNTILDKAFVLPPEILKNRY